MRQTMLPHSWIGLVPCLATVMLISACTTFQSPAVRLDQPVHFVTPAGADIVVKPGMYRVEPAGDSDIHLLSEQGAAPVVLHAEAVSEPRSSPDASDHVAIVMDFEPDGYAVVLRQPGRPTLAARGSVSGIQSRGPMSAKPIPGVRVAIESKAADLVGCIVHKAVSRYICIAWGCGYTSTEHRYWFKITNRGGGPAGQSKARFTNGSNKSTTYDVREIPSGGSWDSSLVNWSWWTEQAMGPRPWTWSVDVENKVAEVYEGNNTSGECPEGTTL